MAPNTSVAGPDCTDACPSKWWTNVPDFSTTVNAVPGSELSPHQAAGDPLVNVFPALKRTPRALLFIPFAALVIAFRWVSGTERPWVPLTFNSADKFMHAIAYGGLATWARVAVSGWPRAPLVALVLAGGYGVVDEIHQSFVPGRSSSVFDVAADVFGASLAIVFIGMLATTICARRAQAAAHSIFLKGA